MITIITGGTVVTASDRTFCDVGIKDGRIVALGTGFTDADEIIDATGKLVLPGGVDAQCTSPSPRARASSWTDDFESGTRSARAGRTTTVMPLPAEKGQSLRAALTDYHARRRANAMWT